VLGLPGQQKPYFFLPEDELRFHTKAFRNGGIKISFIDTNLPKRGLPGTVLVSHKPLAPEAKVRQETMAKDEYDNRFENLAKCIKSAHAFGCPYLRILVFL
jgi:hypothetical protein